MPDPAPPRSLRYRLRRTKAFLLATGLTLAGIVFILISHWIATVPLGSWQWLGSVPFSEFGGILIGAGLLSTLFEYSFRKDQEEDTVERFRDIIKEQAPVMRDAVIDGFAIHPDDLKRVANPELLDDIAANVMALRLGDEQFAREIYADIRDQAIRAPERWYDVEVSVRLSSALERNTAGVPLFSLTVEWEYTTIPTSTVRRFACVSDRTEYAELLADVPTSMPWLMTPRPGMDASSKDHFELLAFSIDGHERPIRRSQRKTGQTYTVDLGELPPETPVRLRHVYRVVTPKFGHRAYVRLQQPTRGLQLSVDYTDTDIASIAVTDLAATGKASRVFRTPPGGNGRELTIESRGWLMPRAGHAFTWTLQSELPRSERTERPETA